MSERVFFLTPAHQQKRIVVKFNIVKLRDTVYLTINVVTIYIYLYQYFAVFFSLPLQF